MRLAVLESARPQASPLRKQYLELKIKILSDLNEKRKPELKDVFNGLLLEYYQYIGKTDRSFNDFRLALGSLTKEKESVPINSFKPVYEQELMDTHHKGRPLVYNKEASNLAHPIKENRVQCYSGSLLFYVLTELAELTDVPRFALFTKGHALPGVLSEDGSELFGIETTASGRARVQFGPVSELTGEIQVIELYPFLLIELLRSEISNFSDLYSVSQEALRKYGFSVENLRSYEFSRLEKLQNDSNESLAAKGEDILNGSPFGFGSPDTLPGDWQRGEIAGDDLSFYDLSGKRASDSSNLTGGGGLLGPDSIPLPGINRGGFKLFVYGGLLGPDSIPLPGPPFLTQLVDENRFVCDYLDRVQTFFSCVKEQPESICADQVSLSVVTESFFTFLRLEDYFYSVSIPENFSTVLKNIEERIIDRCLRLRYPLSTEHIEVFCEVETVECRKKQYRTLLIQCQQEVVRSAAKEICFEPIVKETVVEEAL